MYAKVREDGTIESLFIRPQPSIEGVVELPNDDARIAKFVYSAERDATDLLRAAATQRDDLWRSIVGDATRFEMLRRAASLDRSKGAEADTLKQIAKANGCDYAVFHRIAQRTVNAAGDLGLAYAQLVTDVRLAKTRDDRDAARSKYQATLEAIRDSVK